MTDAAATTPEAIPPVSEPVAVAVVVPPETKPDVAPDPVVAALAPTPAEVPAAPPAEPPFQPLANAPDEPARCEKCAALRYKPCSLECWTASGREEKDYAPFVAEADKHEAWRVAKRAAMKTLSDRLDALDEIEYPATLPVDPIEAEVDKIADWCGGHRENVRVSGNTWMEPWAFSGVGGMIRQRKYRGK